MDPSLVGSYPAASDAGGGYVWDEVLEYRVWCHPADGGDDYFHAFPNWKSADRFAKKLRATDPSLAKVEEPLALILQREYLDEPEPGVYTHIIRERRTEWPVEFLSRPRRTERTIPDFLAPNAPPNRLDIIRGLAPRKAKPGKK